MGWRHTTWARWLGWTVVFGLVVVGGAWLAPRLPSPAGEIVLFGLPVIAAFLIGVRFRSEWWAAGPPVGLVTLVILVILWDKLGQQVPAQTPTPQPYAGPVVTMLVLGVMVSAVLAVLAVAAYKGVTWGQRREAEIAARGGDHPGDGSRFGRG